jgi:hypothetical protein
MMLSEDIIKSVMASSVNKDKKNENTTNENKIEFDDV